MEDAKYLLMLAEFLNGFGGIRARCGCLGDLDYIANKYGLKWLGAPKFCLKFAIGEDWESGPGFAALVRVVNSESRPKGLAIYIFPIVEALGSILGPVQYLLLSFGPSPRATFEFLISEIPEFLDSQIVIPDESMMPPEVMEALNNGNASKVRILENPNGFEKIPADKIELENVENEQNIEAVFHD